MSVTRLVIVGRAASWVASRATIVMGWSQRGQFRTDVRASGSMVPGGRRLRGGRKGSGMFAETSCSFLVAGQVALPLRLATAFRRAVVLSESGVHGEDAVADRACVGIQIGGSASVGGALAAGESSRSDSGSA